MAADPLSLHASSKPLLPESSEPFNRLTHYLFRYPAKFHPPIARALIERFTEPGETVLDPFVGSGTLLVEAACLGRNSIGIDIDPLATIVASTKVKRFKPTALRRSAEGLVALLESQQRSKLEYAQRMFHDLAAAEYETDSKALRRYIPAIPNIAHWFRRYVIIDLARIRRAIERLKAPASHREFFYLVFASIIRNASNADPVPVSGLEVTSHMKRRDEQGRLVNPFALFMGALPKALDAAEAFYDATTSVTRARVRQGDATRLDRRSVGSVDSVVTSPPYHGAVDYYRRHQLEMYWLGLVNSHDERQRLLHKYVGRPKVPRRHPFVSNAVTSPLAASWETRMRRVSEERANAFRHYIQAMSLVFRCLSSVLLKGRPAVFVVGNSSWNGAEIPTSTLFEELAGASFCLSETLSYPIKNRYMSYSRHNGANIRTEHVLVFRRSANGER